MKHNELIGQAMALHRDGNLGEAERIYAEVLSSDPDNVDAVHLLGVIRHQQNDRSSAEDLYRRAIRIQPLYGQAWSNLGLLMQETERWDEAAECFKKVVAIEPSSGSSWNVLGMVLARKGDLQGAEHAYRNAIHRDPNIAEAYNNLGTILARQGDRPGARAILNTALEKRPGYISPMLNMGKLLREEGQLDEAATVYRQALSFDPQAPAAHWGLAHVLLLQGNLQTGWDEYEWRWALDEHPRILTRPEPRWEGAPCEGRQVVLYAEQGLGDAVQFVRYASLVARRGARVTLLVPESLVRFFREIPGVGTVTSSGAGLAPVDYQCPLLSLPRVFGTTLSSIPLQTPLLRAPESVRLSWYDRCRQDPPGFKVGIAWAGSSTHISDSLRSIDPALFEQLCRIEGARVYSLQVNDPLRGLASHHALRGAIDYTEHLNDVAETAGLIARLDLVITVDTLVAHIACAMGKPVWILLPYAPDWRWLLERDDSPWYPTARLFRQKSEGQWNEVLDRVAGELRMEVRREVSTANPGNRQNTELSLGLALHENGRIEEAEARYRSVLRADPDHWEGQYLLAVARYQQKDYQEAIALSRKLIQTHPFFPEAYNTLGNSLRKNGDLIGAEDVLRKAITLRPEHADAHYNLGGCLCDAWRLNEAAEEFLAALRLNPSFTQALNNLGLVRYRQGNIPEAIQYFRTALSQQLEQTDAHWNLAHALLHSGKFAEGWQEFEWRWRMPAFQQLASRYDKPRWTGDGLQGRRLLVWSEQGFGDTIQFMRILPALRDLGGAIYCECHPAMVTVLERMEGISVVGRGMPLPEHEVQIALLSLPAVLGWQEIPRAHCPYVQPDPDAALRWEKELRSAGDCFRVGVVWMGSATNPEGRFRSIPLDVFAGLADCANAFFVSLQKDERADAFKRSPFAAAGRDWTDRLVDFAETAALIEQLDLVITVDTAVAHLAGALGKPVWVLLDAACDWRWGVTQRTTPWYPSMHLYRQQRHGEWDDVVEEARRDLTLLATQIRVSRDVRQEPAVRSRLCEFDANTFASWNNLGVALLDAGCPREAIPPIQQALALEPENPRGHLNLAFAQLVDGQWTEGLENHEWRLKTDDGRSSLRPYTQPRWFGQPLRGKSIFVYAEQGFGDAIQFIRYAWLLAQSGARVVIEVRRELQRLMQHAPGVSAVIVRGDEPPPFDYHSPLLSLAYAFRTTLATVPARTPYLIAGHEQLVVWRKRIDAAGPGMRIGVCWSGNARYSADRERSVTADMLCGILPLDGLLVLPLVKENAPPQRPGSVDPGQWYDITSHIQDFADTAALISYLDLVVTVDTAVAHLAGALGKPVFMLVPHAPDWRWMSSGVTSPWYPTMRLFRQVRRGSWEEPMDLLRSAIEQSVKVWQEHSVQAATQTEECDG